MSTAPRSGYVLAHFSKPCIPRKRHECRVCGLWIAAGEHCCRWTGVTPSEGWWTCHAHPECYALTEDWDCVDWEMPPSGEHPGIRMVWPSADQANEAAGEAAGPALGPAAIAVATA